MSVSEGSDHAAATGVDCSVSRGGGSAVAEGCSFGICPVKNTAINAKIASTASAVRRPSIRAVAFSWRIASAVLGGTWASLSAVFNCASEMNGAPPASWVLACDLNGEQHLIKFSRYYYNPQFWTVPGERDGRLHGRKTTTVTEPEPDEYELYDLTLDPTEERNLAHPSHADDRSRALQQTMLGLLNNEQLAAKRLTPSAGERPRVPAARGRLTFSGRRGSRGSRSSCRVCWGCGRRRGSGCSTTRGTTRAAAHHPRDTILRPLGVLARTVAVVRR